MSVLTKAQIKKAEETAVQNGTFSFKELMYNAGTNAAKVITEKFSIKDKKIAVICGKGNNGGDGCVIAEHLKDNGAQVTVITPFGAPATENGKYYFDKLTVKKTDALEEDYDIIIDAIFGIGFKGEADTNTTELIKCINNQKAVKIAIDIPSGVECDNGFVGSVAVDADLTLTFIALKPCFVLPKGSDFCGEVVVIDIGVKEFENSYKVIKAPVFKRRKHNSHKGTFGTALMICGSYGMVGAAILATKAALRSGLGIAKCVIPESIYYPFTVAIPEAVCVPSDDNNGALNFEALDLEALTQNSNAVLFGCGISQKDNNKKIIEYLIKNCKIPMIIDADGINALVGSIELLKQSKAPIILTPHPGEMARLCGTTVTEIEENRIMYAEKFAGEYGCILVLKGANTIVAMPDGEIFFNIIGNFGMATGGSGDVLAGITVSLLAQGYTAAESAKYAVYLHSLAADKAAEKRSRHALLPTDIIDEL